MAVLNSNQRTTIRSDFGHILSESRTPFNLTKAQLDAAIGAIDDWIEANAASFNSALPTAARNNLTAAQKAHLFYLVAQRRYGG